MAVDVLSTAGLGSLSIPSFSHLPRFGDRFGKALFEEPLYPNRMASNAMDHSIWPPYSLLGLDLGSKLFVPLDISSVVNALPNHRIEAKLCCFCGFVVCILCCCVSVVSVVFFVVVVFLFLFLFYPVFDVVGFWAMMYVIFATLLVGLEALLYINFGFFLTLLSESFPLDWFQWS